MARGSKIRLGFAMLLAAALTTGAFVQTALAQDDEKLIFTYGSTGEPSSLNPMSGYLAVDFYFWTASYHLLLDHDTGFGVEEPDPAFDGFDSGLVTDIEFSDDLMHYTYKIRDDIVWSDGTPLTAEDVEFTLNLYKFNHAYLPQGYLKLIDGKVRQVDDYTIEFDTKQPTGLYKGDIPYIYAYILPKHVFKDFEKPKQFENVPNVGSGPFIIEEYEVGEFVRMVQNPEWRGPEPYVDEIVYRIYKNDDAIATALKTGEIDLAYLTTPNLFNSLQNEANIQTMVGTIPSFSEIGMNTGSAYQDADGNFVPHGDGHPALTDVTVRRAIRMAIDSEELTNKVLLGYGSPGTTIIPPISATGARYDPTGTDAYIAWDLEGAAQLLEDAGYRDTDGDGVREMPAGSLDPGRPLEFRYFVRTSEQVSVDAAPFVSEWLEEIGIKTEVIAVTSGRLGDIINEGTYDLFSWGWIPDIDPASALSWFTCGERPPDGKTYGNNDAYYCNPDYDRLYNAQLAEPDIDARWEIVHEMQRIFYEDAAYSIMWYEPLFSAWRTDRFEGYVFQPSPEGDPLEGYGGPSEVWWTLRPAGTGGGEGGGGGDDAGDDGVVGSSTETRGIPAAIWAVVAGVIVIVGAIVLGRRRRADDEDV